MIGDGVRAANALTARWAATMPDGAAALSGAAVWPLLAYLAAAADGAERAELEAAVGLPTAEAVEAATGLLDLLRCAPGTHAALGLWVDRRLTLRQDWLRQVPVGTVEELSGQDAFDTWVREQTGGLLDGMSVPLSPGTLLVLAMALTARTTWTEPFEDGSLWVGSGPWADRPLAGLHRASADRDSLAVYDTASGPLSVLSVHGGDDITVDLALAEPDVSAGAALAAAITAPEGGPRLRGAQITSVDAGPGLLTWSNRADRPPMLHASLPRFTVRQAHDLLRDRELFGLGRVAVVDRQRLPWMSDTPLAVGAACQELTASFTAQGFVAAAVTRIELRVGSAMRQEWRDDLGITFDRPFAFVARHRPSGLVLVAGWVTDPDPAQPYGFGG